MPKLYVVSWHMDGSFELQADSEEEIHELMKTMNRQELVFKCRYFDYEIEQIDRSATEPDR